MCDMVFHAGGSSHGYRAEACHGISARELQEDKAAILPWAANCTPSPSLLLGSDVLHMPTNLENNLVIDP